MNGIKTILVVRTDRIGDLILTLPVAAALKSKFPGAKISFLVRDYTKDLAINNPFIDEVQTLKTENGRPVFFENIKMLRGKFDTCVVAYPTFKIALILFFSGIKLRIGTGYRLYSFLFNKKIYEHRKSGARHELEYNLNLLKALGIENNISPGTVSYNLHPDRESEQKVSEIFSDYKINTAKKCVIIHPGSGGSSVDWPHSKMIELSTKLAQELDINILITGSDAEQELCSSLIVNGKTINLAGRLNLKELIALINKTEILIANSTGPIHIAAALGKNVIGFYPKIHSCAPERWGPYTEKKIIFSPTIGCGDCTREQCEKFNCMASIEVDDVFNAVKHILKSCGG